MIFTTLDYSFNPFVDNQVNEIIVQPDGKIVIGGNFTGVNSQTHNRVARLSADNTDDSTFQGIVGGKRPVAILTASDKCTVT